MNHCCINCRFHNKPLNYKRCQTCVSVTGLKNWKPRKRPIDTKLIETIVDNTMFLIGVIGYPLMWMITNNNTFLLWAILWFLIFKPKEKKK